MPEARPAVRREIRRPDLARAQRAHVNVPSEWSWRRPLWVLLVLSIVADATYVAYRVKQRADDRRLRAPSHSPLILAGSQQTAAALEPESVQRWLDAASSGDRERYHLARYHLRAGRCLDAGRLIQDLLRNSERPSPVLDTLAARVARESARQSVEAYTRAEQAYQLLDDHRAALEYRRVVALAEGLENASELSQAAHSRLNEIASRGD